MKNIRLALQTLELLGFPLDRVALVANRAGMPGGASVSEMSDTIGRDVRFVLPEDASVPASINSGVPAVLYESRSRFAKGVKTLVGTLVGRDEASFARAPGEPDRERRLRIPGLAR
jgi:pilus assembly protein CpaE